MKSAAGVITVCFLITYRSISIIYIKEAMSIHFYGPTFENILWKSPVFAILSQLHLFGQHP